MDKFLIASIDDYLTGIAAGIRQAQSRLDRLDSNISPNEVQSHGYYLPEVGFEIKATLSLEKQANSKNTSTGAGKVMMRPLQKADLEFIKNTNAVSTLRGNFVAVPRTEGEPVITLRSNIKMLPPYKAIVSVFISSTDQNLEGHEVHFNIDRERSAAENRFSGIRISPSVEAAFSKPIVYSNKNGVASSTLTIAKAQPASSIIVISLDAAGQTEDIFLTVEGGR